MARRNAVSNGLPLNKWAPKAGEMTVCALHKLPVEVRKGKRYGKVPGKGIQLVDADIWFCPAGCSDPHVAVEGDKTTYVPGLTAWKRALPIDAAKANAAEFKKDKAAYLAKVLPQRTAAPAPTPKK